MTGFCKGYSSCSAPPTCYRHYDSANDCIYYDHTPNTEQVTVIPYAPTSFVCPDGTTQIGINAVVACENHGLASTKTQGWECPDGSTQMGTSASIACIGHMITKFYCPDGTYQFGSDVTSACSGHDTVTVLQKSASIPSKSPSITTSTIPTSNNQYPITTNTSTKSTIPTTSTSTSTTKISNPVSTAINVIKSKTTAIPNALFNFYSMYRNYLLGLIILAIFVVIIAKGDKKHE